MSRIFLSYRRADSAGHAGRLYDHLGAHLGEDRLFMDIDNIPPGADFVQVIRSAIAQCDTVIVIIGPQWLTMTDAHGRRRLDDPYDFVRLEVATALARGIPVIPVLVNGARMPAPHELPSDLSSLSRRNALEISNERFQYDVERLMQALGKKRRSGKHRQAARPETKSVQSELGRLAVWGFACLGLVAYILFTSTVEYDDSLGLLEVIYVETAVFVIPLITLVVSLVWPIKVGLGMIFVLALHVFNLLFPGTTHTLYDEIGRAYDSINLVDDYGTVFVLAGVVNSVLVGAICGWRR